MPNNISFVSCTNGMTSPDSPTLDAFQNVLQCLADSNDNIDQVREEVNGIAQLAHQLAIASLSLRKRVSNLEKDNSQSVQFVRTLIDAQKLGTKGKAEDVAMKMEITPLEVLNKLGSSVIDKPGNEVMDVQLVELEDSHVEKTDEKRQIVNLSVQQKNKRLAADVVKAGMNVLKRTEMKQGTPETLSIKAKSVQLSSESSEMKVAVPPTPITHENEIKQKSVKVESEWQKVKSKNAGKKVTAAEKNKAGFCVKRACKSPTMTVDTEKTHSDVSNKENEQPEHLNVSELGKNEANKIPPSQEDTKVGIAAVDFKQELEPVGIPPALDTKNSDGKENKRSSGEEDSDKIDSSEAETGDSPVQKHAAQTRKTVKPEKARKMSKHQLKVLKQTQAAEKLAKEEEEERRQKQQKAKLSAALKKYICREKLQRDFEKHEALDKKSMETLLSERYNHYRKVQNQIMAMFYVLLMENRDVVIIQDSLLLFEVRDSPKFEEFERKYFQSVTINQPLKESHEDPEQEQLKKIQRIGNNYIWTQDFLRNEKAKDIEKNKLSMLQAALLRRHHENSEWNRSRTTTHAFFSKLAETYVAKEDTKSKLIGMVFETFSHIDSGILDIDAYCIGKMMANKKKYPAVEKMYINLLLGGPGEL